MSFEEKLEQFKQYCEELINVGDAEKAIQTDKAGFLKKFERVYKYYKENFSKYEFGSDEDMDVIDSIIEIRKKNPSLEKWTDKIFTNNLKIENELETNTNNEQLRICQGIDSLVEKIKQIKHWDYDETLKLEEDFEEYRERLKDNREGFPPGEYERLLHNVEAALDRIDRIKKLFDSGITF